jgi:glutamate dehydrogenase (NAD(P)+)
MASAFQKVHAMAVEKKVYMRDAAYMISIERVANACVSRGWAVK